MARAPSRRDPRASRARAHRRLRRRRTQHRNRSPVSGGSDDLVLAIEGALGPLSVALASRDGGLERVAEVPANRGLERGLALVAEVLGAIPLDRLEAVAVSTGPGNYTS